VRIRALAVVAIVVAAAIAIGGPASAQPSATAGTLRWRSCGSSFECSTMRVPLDYANPSGPQVDLALIRLPARDQSKRIGSLVVNPGGPGGSGVEYVQAAASDLPSELRDRFDIVGFDPRGVGQSDPLNCKADMNAYYRLDFSPDDDAERAALVSGMQAFVDACERNEGSRLPYLSTQYTVRDLDELRAALGDQKLTFLATRTARTSAPSTPRRIPTTCARSCSTAPSTRPSMQSSSRWSRPPASRECSTRS